MQKPKTHLVAGRNTTENAAYYKTLAKCTDELSLGNENHLCNKGFGACNDTAHRSAQPLRQTHLGREEDSTEERRVERQVAKETAKP